LTSLLSANILEQTPKSTSCSIEESERRFGYKQGKKTKDDLKPVQEITIVKITVQNLANFSMGKIDEFRI